MTWEMQDIDPTNEESTPLVPSPDEGPATMPSFGLLAEAEASLSEEENWPTAPALRQIMLDEGLYDTASWDKLGRILTRGIHAL